MKTFLSKRSQSNHISMMSVRFNKCLSECNSQLNLFSFDYEKRKNVRSDLIEERPTCVPGILQFPIPGMRGSVFFVDQSSKTIFDPVDQISIGINNVKS